MPQRITTADGTTGVFYTDAEFALIDTQADALWAGVQQAYVAKAALASADAVLTTSALPGVPAALDALAAAIVGVTSAVIAIAKPANLIKASYAPPAPTS